MTFLVFFGCAGGSSGSNNLDIWCPPRPLCVGKDYAVGTYEKARQRKKCQLARKDWRECNSTRRKLGQASAERKYQQKKY